MRRVILAVVGILVLIVVVSGSIMLGYYVGVRDPFGVSGPQRTGDQPTSFDVFWQAWAIVHRNFVDRSAIDDTTLTYGALRGMVQALGDEGHTSFLTPEERERQNVELSGKFFGIGAQLGWHDMEICRKESGEPYVVLHGKGRNMLQERKARAVLVSLSHTQAHATAVALLESL